MSEEYELDMSKNPKSINLAFAARVRGGKFLARLVIKVNRMKHGSSDTLSISVASPEVFHVRIQYIHTEILYRYSLIEVKYKRQVVFVS